MPEQNRTTALARASNYMTLGDVLLLELPHFTEDERLWVLWEHTGWPEWFSRRNHLIIELRRQLAEFRDDPEGVMAREEAEYEAAFGRRVA